MKIVMVKDINYADQLIMPVSVNSEEWQGHCMLEGLSDLRKKINISSATNFMMFIAKHTKL